MKKIIIILILFTSLGYGQVLTEIKTNGTFTAKVEMISNNYVLYYINDKYKTITDVKYINFGYLETLQEFSKTRNEFVRVGNKSIKIKSKGNRVIIYVMSKAGVLSYTKPMSKKKFEKLFNVIKENED